MNNLKEAQLQGQLTTAHGDYQKVLNVHAFFRVPDRSISEDLVQDTFIKTWSYLLRGGKIDVMKSFLYHVLNHLIIDEYRKRKTSSLDELLEKGFEPSSTPSRSLPDLIDGKAAVLLIQRLPEKYRKVMRMRYIQDLSIKEIGLLTSQSANTVAVQLHRGVQKTKQLYNRTLAN